MIEVITHLKKIADECECQARQPDFDRELRAHMMDLAVKWHFLAGQAATLCEQSKELTSRGS